MGCAAPNHDYDVPLRIGLLFVILVTSALGVFAPILTSRFTSVSMDGTVIVAMRQFGTGVVISTAIVHVSVSHVHFRCFPLIRAAFHTRRALLLEQMH